MMLPVCFLAQNNSSYSFFFPPFLNTFSSCFGLSCNSQNEDKCVNPSHCIDSLEVRKKPGGHWIIRDLAGLDLVGLASL
ncbi:hypothetical protein FVK33_16065 [Escherichia coli]|nr:hypothetical protein [Escherichia coli]